MGDEVQAPRGGRDHWEAVYKGGDVERLGWFEDYPKHSIEMLKRCHAVQDDLILDVGSGASTFIRQLLIAGYGKVVAMDISDSALRLARARLGKDYADRVTWLLDDVLRPTTLSDYEGAVDVWHDRAVFHFLTEPEDRDLYLRTLNRLVSPNGHIILATFSLSGVERCSGLPVRRYDAALLQESLGDGYRRLHSFECEYVAPSGEVRPYVYTLFRRADAATGQVGSREV